MQINYFWKRILNDYQIDIYFVAVLVVEWFVPRVRQCYGFKSPLLLGFF